jgi:hypothetical protein
MTIGFPMMPTAYWQRPTMAMSLLDIENRSPERSPTKLGTIGFMAGQIKLAVLSGSVATLELI